MLAVCVPRRRRILPDFRIDAGEIDPAAPGAFLTGERLFYFHAHGQCPGNAEKKRDATEAVYG